MWSHGQVWDHVGHRDGSLAVRQAASVPCAHSLPRGTKCQLGTWGGDRDGAPKRVHQTPTENLSMVTVANFTGRVLSRSKNIDGFSESPA